jgi:hypothetical protein
MSIPGDSPAFLFEDRQTPGDWHVQWTDDEGGFEMAIFSGPRARERAIIFAERCYSTDYRYRVRCAARGLPIPQRALPMVEARRAKGRHFPWLLWSV